MDKQNNWKNIPGLQSSIKTQEKSSRLLISVKPSRHFWDRQEVYAKVYGKMSNIYAGSLFCCDTNNVSDIHRKACVSDYIMHRKKWYIYYFFF